MKKKNLQKLLTMALCMSMAASSITGCGGSNEDTASAKAGNESTLSDDYESYDTEACEDSANYTTEACEESAADSYYEYEESSKSALTDQAPQPENGYSTDDCYIYPEPEPDPLYTETYAETTENSFLSVEDAPLSTFSADVDTASYTNVRRMLNDGYTPYEIPTDAVRVEEFINYFSYDMKGETDDSPFSVYSELGVCPWNTSHALFMTGIQTEAVDKNELPDSNLVFLLDVSGSMSDYDKLPLLQQAFEMLVDQLDENDRISIVTYASNDEVVLKGAKGSEKKKILNAIDSLMAGGGTNGSDGIVTAYEIAEQYFIEGGNNRIILGTDGDLNIGLTSEEELEQLISEKKESGIFLSVLGFGTGNIRDNNMELLADKGNGNYSYIDSYPEAEKVLKKELSATLFTVAKDVKLQVEFNPAFVKEYRLIGYENRLLDDFDFADDTKDAGEIGAGHSVVALYELVLTEDAYTESADEINLKYQDKSVKRENGTVRNIASAKEEYCTVNIRYKAPDSDKSTLSVFPVNGSRFLSENTDNFTLASCAAQFGMLLKDSNYCPSDSYKDVQNRLRNIKLDDEYKQEFMYLVRQCSA